MRKAWQRAAGAPDDRIRGRKGQQIRKRRLARSKGLCEPCLEEGRTTVATVVNHKIPLAQGGPDVDENTENLCARHDDIVTAQQFGMQAPIEARGVNAAGRPTSPDHPWNKR
jgi:5-methylcytosine-specific restriction protein A